MTRTVSSLRKFIFWSLVGLVIAVVIWIVNFIILWFNRDNDTWLGKLALMGDSFGYVTSLFTAMALLTLAITLFQLHKHEQDSDRNRQIQLSMQLQDLYFGADFAIVRTSVWEFKQHWNNEAVCSREETIKYFFGDFKPEEAERVIPPTKADNRLTPLQNLSILINFWYKVKLLNQQHLVDTNLIEPLRYEYQLWRDLLDQICREVRAYHTTKKKQIVPDWKNITDDLDNMFGL